MRAVPKPSEREVAAFEAGVKLGALFHQFIGTPVSPDTVDTLEEAIKAAVSLQPYVSEVKVRIDRERLKRKLSSLGYCSLSEDMIEVEVKVIFDGAIAKASLRFSQELNYPLMTLDEVSVIH